MHASELTCYVALDLSEHLFPFSKLETVTA